MERPVVLLGAVALFATMIIGTALSHPAYDWISHTTSELAGQGMPNAWIMRAGFAGYGIAAIFAAIMRLKQSPLTEIPVLLFGAGLVAVAYWSAAPILPTMPVNMAEDWWHSVFATALGFAFACACTARLLWNGPKDSITLSLIGLAASIALPLAMLSAPALDGLLQRVMFAISAIWLLWHYRYSKCENAQK